MGAVKGLLDLTNQYLRNLGKGHSGVGADFLALLADGASRAMRGEWVYSKEDSRVIIRLGSNHETRKTGTFELRQKVHSVLSDKALVANAWVVPIGVTNIAPTPAKEDFVICLFPKRIRGLDGLYETMEGPLYEELATVRDVVPIWYMGWTRRSQNEELYGHLRICVLIAGLINSHPDFGFLGELSWFKEYVNEIRSRCAINALAFMPLDHIPDKAASQAINDWYSSRSLKLLNPTETSTYNRDGTLNLTFSTNNKAINEVRPDLHTTSDHENLVSTLFREASIQGPGSCPRIKANKVGSYGGMKSFRTSVRHAKKNHWGSTISEAGSLPDVYKHNGALWHNAAQRYKSSPLHNEDNSEEINGLQIKAHFFCEKLLCQHLDAMDISSNTQTVSERTLSRRSSVDLTIALHCDKRNVLEKGKVVVVIKVNVKGAFDGVLRNRLIFRLRTKGWPNCLVKWVVFFLSNRWTRTFLDNASAELLPLLYGLPQESPVSPILFLLYVEPLLRLSQKCFGYADDAAIITSQVF
ncbi:hypothetical protein EPUL_000163 [Erysiphe pulchra]|uniref:Reverse transcriptase domain-containing protein n=1 Tax=Erysiphe pulchra TaxID=225359 RepID=A0A2S4Q2A3_9PEZI|nr:hypothetical protein EPUL_000163 [Erysiphe pulchra]